MTKIVNLSESVLIALHSLIIIAKKTPELISSKDLSKMTHASENTIAKVMQRLSKALIIKSSRGPAGGFTLAKPPEMISLLSIFEILEGKIDEKTCPFHCTSCLFGECIFGTMIDDMIITFKETLKKKTLDNFI
ncbi:MAG: Rrf2 family transcriptional regulator [Spirochaetales bacterium]|nr:Rrf2 family transcriptional regulator [Spirochaetales bacterium]